ncbi:MAG: hypothetical protein ACOCXM_11470 [Myxococcota bacterium]
MGVALLVTGAVMDTTCRSDPDAFLSFDTCFEPRAQRRVLAAGAAIVGTSLVVGVGLQFTRNRATLEPFATLRR